MRERRPVLIFDLDGTISDPIVGVTRSLNYALAAFGYPAVDHQEASCCIGPPLDDVFRRHAPEATEDAIEAMVAKYRERYREVGYTENVVYAGIPEVLEQLASGGATLGICTSKRADFAERILDMFALRKYFAFVSGGDIRVRKDDQLRALLDARPECRSGTMIGDRAVDVIAARVNRLRSAGVLWGHGSREELVGAAPDRLLEAPRQLADLAVAV